MTHILNLVYDHKFRHIHAYSRHIKTYLEPCVTLAYSGPCHIQNPDITGTYDTFRTLSRNILAYSEHCVTSHIENPAIFRTLLYSEFWHIHNPVYIGTFRYIQAYSIMIVIITLTFFFFALILHTFQQN